MSTVVNGKVVAVVLVFSLLLGGCANCSIIVWDEKYSTGWSPDLDSKYCKQSSINSCVEHGGIISADADGKISDSRWICEFYANSSHRTQELLDLKEKCSYQKARIEGREISPTTLELCAINSKSWRGLSQPPPSPKTVLCTEETKYDCNLSNYTVNYSGGQT